jgi:thiol-disulfide isomerase/thioredoxin
MGEKMNNAEVQPDSVIQSVHPHFQPVLLALNDSARVLAEHFQREAKNRKMTAPDVPGDQLLQTIAKQYPGKAVFFDLWATWCGPCKIGIEAMEPLKEELKEKDVVFVYLTDESSPQSAWNNYVIKVPGKHYRISSLGQLPGITGIPQYYLFNRQGERVWEQSGFGDETLETIKQEIVKALK